MDPSIPQVQVPKEPAFGVVCMAQVGSLVMRAIYCVHVGGRLTDVVMPDVVWVRCAKAVEAELDLITEPTSINLEHLLIPQNARIVGTHRETGVRFWVEIARRILAPSAQAHG